MTTSTLPERLVGVSTKMYFDLPTTQIYTRKLAATYTFPPACTVFIIPSFPYIFQAALDLADTPHILLGAQDCHWEDAGAFTGSVSPLMLSQCHCAMVELGHAERRRAPFNETDEMIGLKAKAAVRNRIIPLVCIGEKLKSKSGIMSEGVGIAVREVLPQVESILSAIPSEAAVVFAYEPVWAIGAQEPAHSDHVVAVVKEVKRVVNASGKIGDVRVLYGGSAAPGTWNGLKGGVDGLFLGRFGHDLENLKKVVHEVGSSS
ncbi:hypothetical protein MMC19_005250 [Ptychographa xylographoides]|nr:hypothetical protein [Ptychographa xylographoides]